MLRKSDSFDDQLLVGTDELLQDAMTAESVARQRRPKKLELRPAALPLPKVSDYFNWNLHFNRVLALLIGVFALPVAIVAMILTKVFSPRGPVIYSQTRVGRKGKHYTIYKIRSMRVNAELHTGAVWTSSLKDPRITRIGKFLRWSHLDELPQLLNVLKGDMALVGPRPERPEFIQRLTLSVPGYLNRLNVLPGITGLAQVNLPPDATDECVRRKLALDLEYVEKGSCWLDVKILICTALRIVLPFAKQRVNRVLGLDRRS